MAAGPQEALGVRRERLEPVAGDALAAGARPFHRPPCQPSSGPGLHHLILDSSKKALAAATTAMVRGFCCDCCARGDDPQLP